MDNVYVEVCEIDDGVVRVPITSYIMLFLWRACEFDAVKLNFVKNVQSMGEVLYSMRNQYFNCDHHDNVTRPPSVSSSCVCGVIDSNACPTTVSYIMFFMFDEFFLL